MKIVTKLERFLEKHIEGFFFEKFDGALEPVELGKQLARLMEQERSVSVSAIYAPNRYTVRMHPDDYQRLESCIPAIGQELSDYLQNQASRQNYTLIDTPMIFFSSDDTASPGCPVLGSTFSQPPNAVPSGEAFKEDTQSRLCQKKVVTSAGPSQESPQNTQIFAPLTPSARFCPKPQGKLTVVEGADTGKIIPLTGSRINIGRRETNELPLTDLNTSRLHAFIACEEDSQVLYDARSLNGTYVNDQRITRKTLKTGDRIKLGNTLIVYEVR
ncbi:MAG TPA: DUF3662 and FHA domain-containing protein [Patescibacteria group bacterium]|nr:DUF3662 and FHA domain-containing protein [Patescibacteria group bacterium]